MSETSTEGERTTRTRPSVMRGIGANALARILVLPVSAVLGLVLTRIVLDSYGEGAYAQYVLLAGVGALIPFADLGISASVLNAVATADDPRDDRELELTLVSAVRILFGSATVLLAITATITLAGGWHAILGDGLSPTSGSSAAAWCFVVIAVTLLASFGQRVLAGLGKLWVVIAVNGLQTPLVLGTVLVLVAAGWGDGAYLAVIAYAATFLLTIATLVVASRQIRPTVGRALRDARRVRTVRGARVMDTAVPMLVQMIALPLAMQSDRLVLSHVASLDELTEYSLAAQMYNPFVGVIAVAGMALWPVFAKARADGVRSEVSPGRMALFFGAVALGLALVISLASGFLADLASGGEITLGLPLLVAYSCLVVLQAVKYPLGMYMTDARGLRYQAYMVVAMLPVNLGLSIVLARQWGAVGPVIGSTVGVLVFQVAANWWYVRRDLARLDAAAEGDPTVTA